MEPANGIVFLSSATARVNDFGFKFHFVLRKCCIPGTEWLHFLLSIDHSNMKLVMNKRYLLSITAPGINLFSPLYRVIYNVR